MIHVIHRVVLPAVAALAVAGLAACSNEIARNEDPAGEAITRRIPVAAEDVPVRRKKDEKEPVYDGAIDKTAGVVIHVKGIEYSDHGSGGVSVDIEVVDAKGKPVKGVEVGAAISRRGKAGGIGYLVGSGKVTGDDGVVTYDAPDGTEGSYHTRIVWLVKRGVWHDAKRDAGDPGHLKK